MLKKIFFSLLALIFVFIVTSLVYLYSDTPFIEVDTSTLNQVNKSEISNSEFYYKPNDSIKNITSEGKWFKDQAGRTMFLRGINLGGSSKIPFSPPIESHTKDGFFTTGSTVSFVGRPFPLAEADEHFTRLKSWGFHFLRFLITWEAIEHEGPGIYDEAYIEYVYQIVKKANEYNINVFIDPHQDVWSRFSGGDGAPQWTLELAGLDVKNFQNSGAAIVHNTYGDPFPKMIWPTNYQKLAAATMFTLFFGGNDFAPNLMVGDSVPIQDFLQEHYTQSVLQIAKRVKDLPNVIGFDTMNEPSGGFIGVSDLEKSGYIKIGESPTRIQSMALGAGIPQTIDFYEVGLTGMNKTGTRLLNEEKISAWLNDKPGIWKEHGVWDLNEQGEPIVKKPNYFSSRNGKDVNFNEDYYKVFIKNYTKAIRNIDPDWLMFTEPAFGNPMPTFKEEEFHHFVNADHQYDILTLVKKSFYELLTLDLAAGSLVIGKKNVRKYFHRLYQGIAEETVTNFGEAPTLIGEFGIAYDLDDKSAYRTNDFSQQIKAMDRSFNAIESNLINYTLWNYTADNTNERGDQWNGEDLSIFSLDQRESSEDINSGGRALDAVIRPYPYKISGIPLHYHFDYSNKEFAFIFKNDKSLELPTEIFLPSYHFGNGFTVLHSDATLKWDAKNNMLQIFANDNVEEFTVVVKGK